MSEAAWLCSFGAGIGSYSESVEQVSETQAVISHILTDNGRGGFLDDPALGMVNYATGQFTFRATQGRTHTRYKSDLIGDKSAGQENAASWDETNLHDKFTSGSVQVAYRPAAAPMNGSTMSYAPPPLSIDLCP